MVIAIVATLGIAVQPSNGEGFTNPASWEAYNPGANGVGSGTKGFAGGVFDGRYIYFAPAYGPAPQEVLRYDTSGVFNSASSWTTFLVTDAGASTNTFGYHGAVFNGRYVFFVPIAESSCQYEGQVLRYDTHADFSLSSSWSVYDAADDAVASDGGFFGGVFDGQFVYYTPWDNACGGGFFNEVRQYDTTGGFTTASSWKAFAPAGALGGYAGAVFDDPYVYFPPHADGGHGQVLRYDTQGDFSTQASWATFDPGDNGVGSDPDGYAGAVLAGDYVFFVPSHNGSDYHGEILRYNTQGEFASASSWATFNPSLQEGFPASAVGYYGDATYDGRYVYFPPLWASGASGGRTMLRYDTTASFTDPLSWTWYEPAVVGGYQGTVYDGRYVYFVPALSTNGEVVRYDTIVGQKIPAVSEWGMVAMTLLVLIAGTVVLKRRRRAVA